MEKDKVLENNYILKDLFMRESFIMINYMDMGEWFYLMGISKFFMVIL